MLASSHVHAFSAPVEPCAGSVVQVAVRDKPSRQARIVGTRKRGDELLVAEERDGCVVLG